MLGPAFRDVVQLGHRTALADILVSQYGQATVLSARRQNLLIAFTTMKIAKATIANWMAVLMKAP